MAFLVKDDYKPYIRDQALNQVTSFDDGIIMEAELSAQAEMESYLAARYDVANIFNKTGAARNPLIITYMVDIVLYQLHSRIPGKLIPEIRADRYNAAIMWLDKVAEGKLNPDLPLKTVDDVPVQVNFRFGSAHDKVDHTW